MKFLYPRSFPRLLVVGFTLVALPLVFALVNNAISVDQLANRSQNAVYQAVQATQSGRRLSQMLTPLERSARQMLILDDRALLDSYVLSRRRFEQAVADLARLPFGEEQKSELEEILRIEAAVFAVLSRPEATPAELAAAVERFDDLSERAQTMVARSSELIDREVEAMRATA